MISRGIRFSHLSFTYDTLVKPLLVDLTVHFPEGWTGIVGANGAGKTTILRLATGELFPQEGVAHIPRSSLYCPQRTDVVPGMLTDLIESLDGLACELKGRLAIGGDWPARWGTLSHGEQKRAQIAVALWQKPEVLAVDEPTNHLDTEARDLLGDALYRFRGVGLLVSHDRGLLDRLCGQCLFVDPPTAILRPGGYTTGSRLATLEDERRHREYALATRQYTKLKRESSRRRTLAAQSHQRRSKRGIPLKDHDARFKRNLARYSGKDGCGGKLLNQVEGRLEQARETLDSMVVKKTYEMGIWMPGARSRRDVLFHLPSGLLHLGGEKKLAFPELVMGPRDRIALSGPNGGGKSTLVRHIVHSLNLPARRLVYVPQEIDLASARDIMARARNLPGDRLGQMMTVVSRLGSRPQRLLESSEPSPGEIRKVLLATGIANVPHLIIMDEPTNHLDLPSIECLEEALRDCPCGLLLVSHDRTFLDSLTRKRWHITRDGDQANRFTLQEWL